MWAAGTALAGAVYHGILVGIPRVTALSWAITSMMVVVVVSYVLARRWCRSWGGVESSCLAAALGGPAGVCGPSPRLAMPASQRSQTTWIFRAGENFLYDFKPGRRGPDAPPLLRPALAPALLRERAGRLARDTAARMWTLAWLRPGQEGANCAEPPPSVKPADASRSRQPLRRNCCFAVSMPLRAGRLRRGLAGSGVHGLTLGPLRLLGRRPPAGQGPGR